ncbi:ammonium transporter [Bacillus sp. NSP9.1]|uniref:ammonium transporter n=1 Tax=Bacillus sp. NSP9.1 TaxID=1071078 RepID=UPI0004177886|nr:ammonium transporter [Bacillus sp. NSP9.1]QHZ46186.1 ammonium transporter [Bacillus sp. NSP9.1]
MKKKISFALFLSFLLPVSAFAAEPTVQSVNESVNMSWVAIGTLLVFFMHAGFAMVESGFTRAKNTLNILMKNFLTISIGSILYFFVGYAFMFGDSAGGLIGTSGFALTGDQDIGFFVFQAVFAATCATIISGAVAERMKLGSYMILTLFMTGIIYPVVGHWTWGEGWLYDLGFIDFAGSAIVHLTGAAGALAAVIFLGPRIGKYANGTVNAIPGHSIPLGALGVFILWFGWFGFNGGSTLAADPAAVPHVITTTLLAASGGVVSSALFTYFRFGRIDPSLTLNGALAGLVGITAGTDGVSFTGSILIGLIAGVILVISVQFIDQVLKLDDPVGAIAVHGVCGIWGTLAVGLFNTSSGLFYGGGAAQLGIQALGILTIAGWTLAATSIMIAVMKAAGSIRVTKEEEISGLDYAEHGSSAYEYKESFIDQGDAEITSDFGTDLVSRLNNLKPGHSSKTEQV